MSEQLDLNDGDVGIILRADGEVDLFIPQPDDDDADVGDDVLIATAFALRIDDPEFRQEMLDFMATRVDTEAH